MTVSTTKLRNQLRLVSWLAAIDAILLAALITAAVLHAQNWVHVLGPIHGINYLILVATVTLPALDGLWGWWFPLLVFFTGGPIGAFVGEWRLRRGNRT
jgi:hypothetical protein